MSVAIALTATLALSGLFALVAVWGCRASDCGSTRLLPLS